MYRTNLEYFVYAFVLGYFSQTEKILWNAALSFCFPSCHINVVAIYVSAKHHWLGSIFIAFGALDFKSFQIKALKNSFSANGNGK